MKIEAKIVADSYCRHGAGERRLTSFLLTYPRFIHAELMTHRQFSRNAASSRAIPVQRMIKMVEEHPAGPVWWGKNQSGMQAAEPLDPATERKARVAWREAAEDAVFHANRLVDLGVHKQIANRVLEPFQWMTTLVTATEYGNFFALRAHPDAQPEFQELAYEMLAAYLANEPRLVRPGDWHVPFGDRMPDDLGLYDKLKVATARCARLSYLTFDGEMDVIKDKCLHDRLAASGHWSPFEHCATPSACADHWGNFVGWWQYRKTFQGECKFPKDLAAILAARPRRDATVVADVYRNN